ncbi:SUF system Fe-S cluster assembly regulator [Candidatus Sumerlaeota bacterium]|nr:SUF system Fe-S cluster assembly regulator [Candidatus Sumerlaeota bacterium]
MAKMTDYGFILLARIARGEGRDLNNARALAEATHIPFPMVGKILKALARERVLESQRGTKGGYRLAKPAAEITAADVIRALEGPVAVTACLDQATDPCQIEALCPTKSNWRKINDAVLGALEGITLEEMAKPMGGLGNSERELVGIAEDVN